MSRKRVFLGGALSACKGIIEGFIVAGIIGILFAIAFACPGEVDAQTLPKKLAVAQGRNWSTDALVANTGSTPVHVDFALCLINGASADLQPGEAFRVQDVGFFQCSANPLEFYLLDALPFSRTLAKYNDGRTANSYDLPPLGAIPPGGWLRISPVVSDSNYVTTVNTFGAAVRIIIDVFDAHNKKIGTEYCDAVPPVTQCALQTRLNVGSLELSTTSFQGPPPPVYGFVAVTNRDGSNARVLPF